MIAVLKYWYTDNPLNFPGDYPAETKPVKAGEKVLAPWILMEESELKAISESLYPLVKAAFEANAEASKNQIEQKESSLKATFDQLQSIKNKIDGAGGKLESADQIAVLTYALETLLQLREPLIQMHQGFVGRI